MSWSSGKDSAWALSETLRRGELEVVGLITTFNEVVDRVAMHGVRRQLVEAQARSLGLTLYPVFLPERCSNDEYERLLGETLRELQSVLGITHVVFGDLFLEDIRRYRERQMEALGLKPVFPIWNQPTEPLAREMISTGMRAVVTCVDSQQLPASFSGRVFDSAFVDSLPAGVDSCGENGEFHTFVSDGPMFGNEIPVVSAETVVSDERFVFTELRDP